jgi:septal ring factor EnvC (AmiA/AmiB activator)
MNHMEALNFLQFYTRIIGQVEEGMHQDEALPRAESFLKERANWQSEVEALREKIREQELIIQGMEEGAEEWRMKCSDLEHQIAQLMH